MKSLYILQDWLSDFQQSQCNNLIGQQGSAEVGWSHSRLVISQNTFEIWGEHLQILQQSGIHVAAFGRGVKPIGFDNKS